MVIFHLLFVIVIILLIMLSFLIKQNIIESRF